MNGFHCSPAVLLCFWQLKMQIKIKANDHNYSSLFFFHSLTLVHLHAGGAGEGELAAAHYQQAVRLKPAHYVAMVNLGRLLRSSNDNQEAESWYKR